MGWQPVGPTSSNGDGHTSFGSPHSLSLHLQPGHRGTRDNIYGYLAKRARIEGSAVDVFTDSGASFNAISPVVASRLALTIKESDKPLKIKLGVKRTSVFLGAQLKSCSTWTDSLLTRQKFSSWTFRRTNMYCWGYRGLSRLIRTSIGSPNQSVHGGRHH